MDLGSVGGREGVVAAIRSAASATGVDFDFLLRTAQRESSLNPAAKARTSSASGLFQFIEQTWLSTLKAHGAKHGLGRYAEMIERGSGGRLTVPDADNRRKVLDLRFDATAAARMGAELAADSASYLRGRIGREPTGGELYAAHFLGPVGSAKLILAKEQTPGASAASLFPAAAGANRSIFYRAGGALSVADVYANLTRSGDSAGARVVAAARPIATAVARPVAAALEAVQERIVPAAITVRELTTPVRAAARDAAAPAIRAVQQTAAPVVRAVNAAVENATPDPMRAALDRAERARREALLIDLILGEESQGGSGGSPLSAELLNLLASTKDRKAK